MAISCKFIDVFALLARLPDHLSIGMDLDRRGEWKCQRLYRQRLCHVLSNFAGGRPIIIQYCHSYVGKQDHGRDDLVRDHQAGPSGVDQFAGE